MASAAILRLGAIVLVAPCIVGACLGGNGDSDTMVTTKPTDEAVPASRVSESAGRGFGNERDGTPLPTVPPQSPTVISIAHCGGDPAASLTLDWVLGNAPHVVVGRAGGLIESRVQNQGSHRSGVRVIEFTIDRVLTSLSVAPGQTLRVRTIEWSGAEECKTPGLLLDQDVRYLLFLAEVSSEVGTREYSFYPELRFKVNGAGLLVPSGYEWYSAAFDISRVPDEEVRTAWDAPDPEAALDALARQPIWKAEQVVLATLASMTEAPSTPDP